MVIVMIKLSIHSFNHLQRDQKGPRVQREWFSNYDGLGVDLNNTKKSIIFKYKSPITGRYSIAKIGSYSYSQKLTRAGLKEIDAAYYAFRGDVARGDDPLQLRAKARAEQKKRSDEQKRQKAQAVQTVDWAFKKYQQSPAFSKNISARTQQQYSCMYNLHIQPALGNVKVSSLRRKDVITFLDTLTDAGFNNCLAILKMIERLLVDREYIENPFCHNIRMKPQYERDRIVEDLPAFLSFLERSKSNRSYRNALKMQLLTACRATELFSAHWNEVDFAGDVWTIPWERVKTQKVAKKTCKNLVLPIMPAMSKLLHEQAEFSTEGYVFKQARDESKPIGNSSIHRFLRDHGFEFSSHDIRRTAATHMWNECGASESDIKILLNHAVEGATRHYVRGDATDRRRKVYSVWHGYLDSLVPTDGVSYMKKTAN